MRVSRCQGGGNCGALCSQLPLLRRLGSEEPTTSSAGAHFPPRSSCVPLPRRQRIFGGICGPDRRTSTHRLVVNCTFFHQPVFFHNSPDSSVATEGKILEEEKYIFETLEWNMGYPNPIHFLCRVSKADEYNVQARTVAKCFLKIECVEWRLVADPPSLLAAASIWLARFVLWKEDWTPNLAHYSSYPESAIIPMANLMINHVLKPVWHSPFFKKYAAKKFMKESTCVRSWALERWPENKQVNLAEGPPSLKAPIRAQCERAIAAGIDPDVINIMEEGGLRDQSWPLGLQPSVNLDASVYLLI
jgi:hypothetical protein